MTVHVTQQSQKLRVNMSLQGRDGRLQTTNFDLSKQLTLLQIGYWVLAKRRDTAI